MISQCWGLAEALGVQPLQKIWTPRAPWKFLPPALVVLRPAQRRGRQ